MPEDFKSFSVAPHLPLMLAPHLTTKSNKNKTEQQLICRYPAQWEGRNCFSGTSCLIQALLKTAHRKSAAHSSLFRDFVLSHLF